MTNEVKKSWTLDVKEDPDTKDIVLEFTDDMLEEFGWATGDVIEWKDNGDGSWTLTKKN